MNAPGDGSALSVVITKYLALKTVLGRRYALERRVFETLMAFLQTRPGFPTELTPETFSAWAQTLQHLAPTVRRNHLRIVRNLCLYRRRLEPACFIPDLALFPAPHHPRSLEWVLPDSAGAPGRRVATIEATCSSVGASPPG
jgi:integrase/recombinase XerD